MESGDRAFLEEMLAPLGGVAIRRMFGGLGIFRDGLMFGLVARGALYLKAAPEETDPSRPRAARRFSYATQGGRTTPSPATGRRRTGSATSRGVPGLGATGLRGGGGRRPGEAGGRRRAGAPTAYPAFRCGAPRGGIRGGMRDPALTSSALEPVASPPSWTRAVAS